MFSAEDMKRFWPHADPAWRDAFVAHHVELGAKYGVNTPRRWRHFLSQVSAETNGLMTGGRGMPLKGMVENHKYSAQGIKNVFAKRLRMAARDNPAYRSKSLNEIAAIWAKDGEALFEGTYGNRRDLGNVKPGDGWKFRGRTPLQNTGREIYTLISEGTGLDCVEHPELLEDPRNGWEASFFEWAHSNCNALADANNCDAVSRRVNGGTNGLAERRAWLKRAEQYFPDASSWEDLAARERASLGDLAKVSRKAAAVQAVRNVAVVATGTSTAVAAGGEVVDAIKPVIDAAQPVVDAVKPAVEVVTNALPDASIIEQMSEWTSNLQIFKGFTGAITDVISIATANPAATLALGAGGVAFLAFRLGKWIVEDFRSGRYEPSGGAAQPVADAS